MCLQRCHASSGSIRITGIHVAPDNAKSPSWVSLNQGRKFWQRTSISLLKRYYLSADADPGGGPGVFLPLSPKLEPPGSHPLFCCTPKKDTHPLYKILHPPLKGICTMCHSATANKCIRTKLILCQFFQKNPAHSYAKYRCR